MPRPSRPRDERINLATSVPFVAFHVLAAAALTVRLTGPAVALGVGLYFVRLSFLTIGYHRLLSHRAFTTGRVVQFLLALGATTAVQKGPLWWSAGHRHHHRYADTGQDIHSPRDGFWWSHVGWVLCDKYKSLDYDIVRDLSCYPELRALDRYHWVAPAVLAAGCLAVAGPGGLLFGFFLSTVLLWHAFYSVNSMSHRFGSRRYETSDGSHNVALLALITNGEGWHNNHHHYPQSARVGFRWWEVDPSYYAICALEACGLARDVRRPTSRRLQSGLTRGRGAAGRDVENRDPAATTG